MNGGAEAKSDFLFVAERAWLDFVNTEMRVRGAPVDLLSSYGDLIRWLERAGLMTNEDARTVAKRWGGTAAGEEALRRAHELRATLRRLAENLAAGGEVSPTAIRSINAALRRRPGSPQLTQPAPGGTLEKRFVGAFETAASVLAPMAEAAADSLASDDVSLVRRCANPDCVLVFLDTTKNHLRRWCSMDLCGSRAKAAAYYARTKRGRVHVESPD